MGLGDWMVKLYFALNLLSGDLNFGFLVFISLSATCIPSLLDLLGGRVETVITKWPVKFKNTDLR